MGEFTVVSEKHRKKDKEIIMVDTAGAGGLNFKFQVFNTKASELVVKYS